MRLILALMLVAFALPGQPAACHAAGGPVRLTMHHGQHHAPAKAPPIAEHQMCLGCIPPSTWYPATIAPVIAVPAMPRITAIIAFVAGRSAPPALPPPRRS